MAEEPVKTRKRLVINADDFGYCDQRNRGIVESFQNGVVSSTTLLVNAFKASEAVLLSRQCGIPLGLHVNLTEGIPVKMKCSSLTSENGFFKGKFGFREALKRGEVDLEEVKQEIHAQLQWFVDAVGLLPTHIDGHQHVHIMPQVCEIIAVVMKNAGIKWTRIPAEMNFDSCVWIEEPRRSFFQSVVSQARDAKETFSTHGIKCSTHFIGLSTMGKDMTINRLKQALELVYNEKEQEEGTQPICELMVHPGYKSIMGCGGCGEGPDVFACSVDREHELLILTGPDLKDYLRTNKIQLLSFKKLL